MGKLHFLIWIMMTAAVIHFENVLGTERKKIEKEENPSVTRLREYLRLKAVHPDPDYGSSIAWIKNQALEIGLEYTMVEFEGVNSLFTIFLTWRGTDQNLSSILLNSHIDVVPVDEDKWTHDPWAAEKDEVTGNIFARGSQDMKSVGVEYLEVIMQFKAQGLTPLRNVHISFVPDEEVGGMRGMAEFVKSKEFEGLNVGFAMDEGRGSEDDEFFLMWAERAIWQVEFTAEGQSGHASGLHDNTAAEKIQKIINLMLQLRTREKERMESENLELAQVTTINLTVLKGGQQPNVIPSKLSAIFDIRITPYWTLEYVEEILTNFSVEAGPDVTFDFIIKSDIIATTPLIPENIWWTTFQRAADDAGIQLHTAIQAAATDVRYIRQLGVPAFGFSPHNKTPRRAHDHDEFINENIFLEGIHIYEQILPKLFNLP